MEKLDPRPNPKLKTNFDYRINPFTDFYDLESDNFDAGLQKVSTTSYWILRKDNT